MFLEVFHGPRNLALLVFCGFVPAQEYSPKIHRATADAAKAIEKFKVPADLEVTLFAAEPALANPVAFCIDTRGRIYVAESFRLHRGVTDNREHQDWIDQELACRTVADRVKMYERKFAKEIGQWKSEHERIRVLEDTDGDGVADRSEVFADGFKDLADGIGAGLIAYQGRIWFTCIPKLWLLEDVDDDGKADRRRVLHDGFGVHTSLLGHDLHGLRIGPDGKLYFSIGDRGFHVVTPDRTLSMPDEGAVFRCNLDGTDLEVVHRGLRNPQELAFDRFGNLFTGDNNSDGGDKARWVYIVEGGNSGWHIGYQSISDRGPWNRERLWHPHHRGQAAYLVPPIANLINGPAGLTYDPGVGLPPRYRDRFFLCEFRGSSSISGVVALKVQPKGAGFELTDTEEFLWRILPTDVEFGFDGGLYVSDWIEGWNQPLRGRLYRVGLPGSRRDPRVLESARLMREGMGGRDVTALVRLLDHFDQRVRQEAQFELVRRHRLDELAAVAGGLERRMARIHAIWALGQLGRGGADVAEALVRIVQDPDHEIRAQVAKVLGQCKIQQARKPLIARLEDRSSRVRFFAAISLGQLGDPEAVEPLIAMLRANDGRDAYLRHAGIQGLVGMPDEAVLLDYADDESVAVRLALVVVLRRRQSAAVKQFFDDADPLVVLEAARAVHDVPIPVGMADLAALLTRPTTTDDALVRRSINANFRLGTSICLQRLVRYATGKGEADLRTIALDALRKWRKPSGRDRVINLWRPVAPRDSKPVAPALDRHLNSLLADPSDAVVHNTVRLLRDYEIRSPSGRLRELVADEERSADLRVTALQTLEGFASDGLGKSARIAADSEEVQLRKAGIKVLAHLDPAAAVPMLVGVIDSDAKLAEQQGAVTTLGELGVATAEQAILDLLDRMIKGDLKPGLHLDLIEAATAIQSIAVGKRLAEYRKQRDDSAGGDMVLTHLETLRGGDRNQGSDVFWKREDATSCKKCHSINGRGGNAGPDLGEVGDRLTRQQILASLLDPSREIAKGFGTFVFTLDDDTVVAGMILRETDEELVLLDAADKEVRIAKGRVKERSNAVSSMLPMAGLLQRRELRDIIEFLQAQRKEEDEPRTDENDKKKSAAVPRGEWRAWLDCPGGELPFELHFRGRSDDLGVTIQNGSERIPIPIVQFADGELTMELDYYDSKIVATLDAMGTRLDGTWTKRRGGMKMVRMAFHATAGAQPRFAGGSVTTDGTLFTGRWRVQFQKDKRPAVGVFQGSESGEVTGTFLTTLGDYRFLAGNRVGDAINLSCFDGAHAFLFRATIQAGGGMFGDFWSSNTWHETFSARRDATAKLPDAWLLTTADTSDLGRLRFPDLEGNVRGLNDPAFAGRARILVVFGSWCPNCRDETAYLAELDRKYRGRGLSIVGLAFEHSGDPKRDARILRTYAKRQGIEFPILLAGLSDKAKASQALPILDEVRAFPTTLFLRGNGELRGVHTGFSGPGTGAEHQKLRKRFEDLIEALLKAP